MDYVKPADVVTTMVSAGSGKLALSPTDLMIRGALSGAILGVSTSLAFTAAIQTGQPLVGALVFPVGLVIIVLLGLELLTGSFALVPLPWLGGRASGSAVLLNWGWVFLGNLIGSVVYGALLAIVLTDMGTHVPAGLAARIITVAEAKTTAYEAMGLAGMVTVFVKAILCNWLVCLAVVNMFVIPTGMMLGAKVTVAEWWLWNQIPVTLGNLVGGFVFTGFALYATYKPKAPAPAVAIAPQSVPAE
jgi:formate/nitrite transporter FocA (FNT family)